MEHIREGSVWTHDGELWPVDGIVEKVTETHVHIRLLDGTPMNPLSFDTFRGTWRQKDLSVVPEDPVLARMHGWQVFLAALVQEGHTTGVAASDAYAKAVDLTTGFMASHFRDLTGQVPAADAIQRLEYFRDVSADDVFFGQVMSLITRSLARVGGGASPEVQRRIEAFERAVRDRLSRTDRR